MVGTDDYSGIVINQDAEPTSAYTYSNKVYQTFTLPSDYQRGSGKDALIPDLSGLQLLVSVADGYDDSASLDYTLELYEDNSWIVLTSGTVIGSHSDGDTVWYDIYFDKSISLNPEWLNLQFRFSVQTRSAIDQPLNQPVQIGAGGGYLINNQSFFSINLANGIPYPISVSGIPAFLTQTNEGVTYSIQQGIEALWVVSPTPLIRSFGVVGQAYQADGITPLLGAGSPSSLNFRLLALTADEGTNFFNNDYQQAVAQQPAKNVLPASPSFYLSAPQPSPFAVVSLYFDVRPVSNIPQYGEINSIGNPSFEYDAVGHAPLWWQPYTSGAGYTITDQTVSSNWSYNKAQSLHMQYNFTASNQSLGIVSPYIPITATTANQPTPISGSIAFNVISISNCTLYYGVSYYDSNFLPLTSLYNTVATSSGANTASYSTTVPANAVYVTYQAIVTAGGGGPGYFEGYIDQLQITFTPSATPYFDGDYTNAQWSGQRGQSPSFQLIDNAQDDNYVVVDGVLVDPLTPNMAFNVYYTEDDAYTSATMNESDWEQKLWTRVPKVFLATQRQQYMFPQPVHAKYLKVEFTNLPAHSYDPGDWQKPTMYKKFPTWVANFFLNEMEVPSFVVEQVNVQHDALSFAYNYYLDDINQRPDPTTTLTPPQTFGSQVPNYFDHVPTDLDTTTLSKIKLAMQPYQHASGTDVDTSTLLGRYATNLASVAPTISEGGITIPIDYSAVSSLQREPLILEQSMPVMFFFVTCRHAYKELWSDFEYKRAYFAGVNQITFLRQNYTTQADTSLYIETGGDAANTEFSDWVIDTDKVWYTYG